MSQYTHGGLERDLRQDADEFPTVYHDSDQPKYLEGKQPNHLHGEQAKHAPLASHQPGVRKGTACGIQRTTSWLIIALAVVLILGVVGVGVAGSLAVKRGHTEAKTLVAQTLSPSTTVSPESTKVACPTLSSSAPTNSVNVTHLPADDCDTLPQPPKSYVSSLTHHLFSVRCATDFPGNDMIGIFVYSFVDCIEACASYTMLVGDPRKNLTCVAVSYDITFVRDGGGGNCFLKGSIGNGPLGKNVTSSAVVITE